MEKNRITALDGLRGFAAFSVMLSHIGFALTIPLIGAIYQILAVGPNSVQILFVLSGFLMAYLYPRIKSSLNFIQKRYTRIFPVYSVVVLFIWLISLEHSKITWFEQLGLLFLVAASIHLSWHFLRKFSIWDKINKQFFYLFLLFQALVIAYGILLLPKLIYSANSLVNTLNQNLFPMFTNITLATPFVKAIGSYSSVFWSLTPEILFYILYPFIVIPIINLAKKFGPLITTIIILAFVKIFFDLDNLLFSEIGLRSMQIGRANGFVIGVLVGTLYQTKGNVWNKLEIFIKKPVIDIAILIGLILIQWADGALRNGSSVSFTHWYYLVSSCVIGLVVISALIPNTLINKIFKQKILVFLGLISYSLYISHLIVIDWVEKFISSLNLPTNGPFVLLRPLTSILFAIIIAFFLFKLIENMYFLGKKRTKEKDETLSIQGSHSLAINDKPTNIRYYLGFIVACVIFFILYSGDYAPSLALSHNNFPSAYSKSADISLLKIKTIRVPIQASYDNLSTITLLLNYKESAQATKQSKINPATLIFKLYDAKTNSLLLKSEQKAFMVEGAPRFPFGFLPLNDSKDKKYIAEFSLLNGDKNDQVFIDTSPTSVVSAYSIIQNKTISNIVALMINRLLFTLTNLDFLFALGFIACMILGVYISSKKGSPLN